MQYLLDLIHNHILIVALTAWAISQICKVIINFFMNKEWSIERLWGDGGMPSGHSATVSAMAVMTGYLSGLDSIEFGLATIFAIVVMHDASGVRRETGKQAVSILQLIAAVNDMLSDKDKISQSEKLKVLVGHSPLQVFFGALTGVIVSTGYILLFMNPFV